MSLTTCMKKAGKNLRAEDKSRILALSRQYRGQGMTATEAAIKAVDEQLQAIEVSIAKEVERTTKDVPIAAKKSEGKVEDFGEKLPPARRNMAAKLDESLSDEKIATLPFSQVWPAAENDAIEDAFAAAVAHAARAEVPAKPRVAHKISRWVEKVKTVRELASVIVSGKVSRDDFLKRSREYALKDFIAKVKLLEGLDRADWKRIGVVSEAPNAYQYGKDGTKVAKPMVSVTIDGRHQWIEGSGDILQHVEAVRAMLGKDTPESRMQFEIRRDRAGKFLINKKGDKETRTLLDFDTVEEARAAIKDRYTDLLAAWEGVKDRDNISERDLRTAENRPRSGKDHRGGKDVTAEQFQETFGFRGGEFGKWVSQGNGKQERQAILNSTYDALMDLSDLLGIPPRAISLEGSLGLAFGSRGGGWASAHFEPSNLVINLTKPRGAGALAHEWFHAMDNYFARKRGGEVPFTGSQDQYRRDNFVTYKTTPMMVRKDGRGTPVTKERLAEWRKDSPGQGYLAEDQWIEDPKHKPGVRAEVEQSFADLVKALNASPMLQRSRVLDGKKEAEGYWSQVIERAARSFENYVQTRMMEQGYHNDFLANVKAAVEVGKNKGRYPYLMPDEIAPIAEAFDNLFQTIETKASDKGVAMYARGGTPDLLAVDEETEALVQQYGEPVGSIIDAERRHAAGERIFAMHEQDETISEITSVRQLKAWAPDQLVAVHRGVFEDSDGAKGGSKKQTETPAFKKWFGDSIMKSGGKPTVMYHGTTADIETFKVGPTGAIFVAEDPQFAGKFADGAYAKSKDDAPNVLPVYVRAERPFDFENAKHVEALIDRAFSDIPTHKQGDGQDALTLKARGKTLYTRDVLREAIKSGQWALLEEPEIHDAIKALGHDSLWVSEDGRVNLGVYSPTQLKSATGNRGTFDPSSSDITMARGMDAAAFRRAFGAPTPMDVDRAQGIVDQLTSTWDNGPKLKVVATAADLPGGDHPSDARGLIQSGTAYIVAGNNPTRDAVARTLGHEAIGHYGLWKSLGDDGTKQFQRNLQLALKTGNKPLARIRDKVRRLYVDDSGKFNLTPAQEADEIAAFAVEEAIDPTTGEFKPGFGFMKSVWAKVADFLRKLGIKVKFTNLELQGLLVSAMRGLEAGKRLDGGADVLVAAARDDSPEGKALQALSENDDLFALPKSDKATVEEIVADNDPDIKVRKTKIGSETLYTLTMPGGDDAKLWVRPANPYGEQIYSMDLVDGDTSNVETGRPGENPEDVDPATEDVYLDVSNLKPGASGNTLYNIAATFAHNTGRIFIGDPSGLSDSAMRRRLENMISTALKFGTTDHIAPHPRQVKGDAKIGVPPLKWVYGDSLGNIRRMIDASLKSEETGALPKYDYDTATGNFSPVEGGSRSLAQDPRSSGRGLPDVSGAPAKGWRTGTRAALFRALLREGGEAARGGDGRDGNGLLAKLLSVAHQYPRATHKIFYARGPSDGSRDSGPAAGRPAGQGGNPAAPGQPGVTPPAGTPPATPTSSTPGNAWSLPDDTRTDRVIYELQDSRVDLKRAQQAIEAAGRDITEQWDARLAETLYPGRVAHRSKQFLDADVKPLLKSMAASNVDMAELSDYLHARGAEERNAQIAKVNPDLQDGGAGKNSKGVLMTNQAAKDYLAGISTTRKQVLDAMAKHVDAITAGTRKLLVAEGLEKQETIDAWEKAYKNYVPMFRDEAESGTPHPQGTGFAVKGSASKRATGSTKQVTNMLAHVLMQREAAITRAEKNRVALALYGMALSHPNADFWTTIKPSMSPAKIEAELTAMGVDPATAALGMERAPTIRTVDETSGKAVDRPNPMYRNLPGAIPLKVNGEDRVLMLNTGDDRGQRLADSLKNLDGLTRFDLAGSIVGRATRWLAAVNTQYNPAFGLVNLTRDTLGGAINLGSTELRGNALKVLAQAPAAIGGIAWELMNNKQSGKWGKLYRQFVADGGQTGYKEMWRDPHERARALEKEMKAEGKLTPGKAAHAILDLLDGFNTTLENAVRLSAYSAGLDKGLSRAEAARLGRELTVDFNRKGRAGREVGPLYAFFNASVQGTARTIETLKGPTGTKIIAGGLSLGVLQALMLASAGYDDDDIPEFVKTRALIIPMPGDEKKFIAIPYPLGLHVLPNTGRVLTELVLSGGKKIGKRSVDAIGEIAAAFNPLGGGNVFTAHGALTTAAPTVMDPMIDLAANRNFAGGTIEKQSFGADSDNRPGAARVRESTRRSTTGQVYIGISEAINRLTGGTQYEAGMASPTPERVRYLAQTVGGGVLRELEKGINASTAAARGEKVKTSQIPVVGRFYGEVDKDQVATSRYFESSRALRKTESSFKAMDKAGDADAVEAYIKDNPEVILIQHMNEVQRAIAELNRLAVTTVGDPKEMAAIDDTRVRLMDVLNESVKELEARQPTLADKLKPKKAE